MSENSALHHRHANATIGSYATGPIPEPPLPWDTYDEWVASTEVIRKWVNGGTVSTKRLERALRNALDRVKLPSSSEVTP